MSMQSRRSRWFAAGDRAGEGGPHLHPGGRRPVGRRDERTGRRLDQAGQLAVAVRRTWCTTAARCRVPRPAADLLLVAGDIRGELAQPVAAEVASPQHVDAEFDVRVGVARRYLDRTGRGSQPPLTARQSERVGHCQHQVDEGCVRSDGQGPGDVQDAQPDVVAAPDLLDRSRVGQRSGQRAGWVEVAAIHLLDAVDRQQQFLQAELGGRVPADRTR